MSNNGHNGNNGGMDDLFGEEGQSLFSEIGAVLGDPNNILKDPFSAIQKLMANPNILQKIDKMYSKPEVREQIEQSMNNPFFQSMVQSNPELNQFYDAARSMKQDQGVSPAETEEEDGYEPDALYDDEDDDEMDEDNSDPIDWLHPPHNAEPFELPLSPSALKFSRVISAYPSDVRSALEILAEQRLVFHLGSEGRGRLEEIASREQVSALDLMLSVGGFVGDWVYAAVDKFGLDFTKLAKIALERVRVRSGYPVASFMVELMLHLDEYDAIERADWEHFAWCLSANPVDCVDGNFSLIWEDATLLSEIIASQIDSPELAFALILGMLQWNVTDVDEEVENPLATLLQPFNEKQRASFLSVLWEFLKGKSFHSVCLKSLTESLAGNILQFASSQTELGDILLRAAGWKMPETRLIHELLLRKLDLMWSKVPQDVATTYIDSLIAMDDPALKDAALRVGKAWDKLRYTK